MSRRALVDRLRALETQGEAKAGTSVWLPGEIKPDDWDAAEIQVDFPDCGCCEETEP